MPDPGSPWERENPDDGRGYIDPWPKTDKEAMRERFARYDEGLAQMVKAMKEIREAAPDYWKAQGYTILPRLERLREDVMKGD